MSFENETIIIYTRTHARTHTYTHTGSQLHGQFWCLTAGHSSWQENDAVHYLRSIPDQTRAHWTLAAAHALDTHLMADLWGNNLAHTTGASHASHFFTYDTLLTIGRWTAQVTSMRGTCAHTIPKCKIQRKWNTVQCSVLPDCWTGVNFSPMFCLARLSEPVLISIQCSVLPDCWTGVNFSPMFCLARLLNRC